MKILFTKDNLPKIQDKMRNKCVQSFNKEYGLNAALKDKQKGRNIDYRVSQMADYDELKKNYNKQRQKINKLNNQTKDLNTKSEEIKDIINNLKNQPLSNKNLLLSNQNKDNEISSLKSKIKELKDSLEYWKDKFQRVVKFIHDKIHGIFGDKDDKYKEMADNLFINGIIDEKEYTSVINKKDKNRDDFER